MGEVTTGQSTLAVGMCDFSRALVSHPVDGVEGGLRGQSGGECRRGAV